MILISQIFPLPTFEASAAPLRCCSPDQDAVTPNGPGRARAMRYLATQKKQTNKLLFGKQV